MRICYKCKKREGAWWDHLCSYCRNRPASEKEALEYDKKYDSRDIPSPEQIEFSAIVKNQKREDIKNKFMKEKLEKYKYVILAVLILATTFYWYEWRPTQIRKDCYDKAQGGSYLSELAKSQTAIDKIYQNCLRSNGLEK